MLPLNALNPQILACERCPRLREHCLRTARDKRAAYRSQTYFGLPVPNFGDPDAGSVGLLIVGLAPGAHGANRTGRMFTGDRSGDFLFRALFETGFANQPLSRDAADGLALRRCLITAACHCAPPGNRPAPDELARCAPFLDATFDALPRLKAILCLGRLAFDATLRLLRRRDALPPDAPAPRFAHGAQCRVVRPAPDPGQAAAPLTLLCSYHPSQQNTFTGRLTADMLRGVLERARALLDAAQP